MGTPLHRLHLVFSNLSLVTKKLLFGVSLTASVGSFSQRGSRRRTFWSPDMAPESMLNEPDLAMASALRLPQLATPLSKMGRASTPMLSPRNPWGHAHIGGPTGPYLHKTSDVFCNPGRFQNVPTARSQGEVYIHEHDHGFVESQSPRLCSYGDSVSSQRSLATVRSQRGEVSGRANAARRARTTIQVPETLSK